MLLLLFHIHEDQYAIDTAPIIEIMPVVELRKVRSTTAPIAGMFNYRGNILPVIDLCRLIGDTECPICYSSRLIIIDATKDLVNNHCSTSQFGLLAEQVTETLKVDDGQFKTTQSVGDAPYLGKLLIGEMGMLQMIRWQYFADQIEQLVTHKEGTILANGAAHH